MTSPSENISTGSRTLPGEAGVWLFIAADLMVFSLFFATFLYYRAEDPALFRSSQEFLSQTWGAINTGLMLTSSWLVATAVHVSRKKGGELPAKFLILAFLCGVGFAVVKFFEWGEKIGAGITINTNDFFMYYFVFTGIHFVHVLIGMGVLAFFTAYCWKRKEKMDADELQNLESGGIFWHMVDLLWIVLFALLYLVR